MITFVLSALIAHGAMEPQQSAAATGRRDPREILLGSCRAQGRDIDLTRVDFLENRSIERESPNGPVRVEISVQSVSIELIGTQSNHPMIVHDIRRAIEHGQDLDIDLKLGYLDRDLVLYWRETFQHRTYRQGLFTVSPPSLVPLCEGRGGLLIED